MKLLKAVLFCLLVNTSAWSAVTELKVAVSGFSGVQREALLTLAEDFHGENPGIKINFVLTEDSIFKDRLNDWLSERGEFDLIIWHAGQRLKDIASRGYAVSLKTIWQDGEFDDYFSAPMKEACSYQGEPYGIPISTYQWGFYYNRAVFKKYNLKEPVGWAEFIALLARLKREGIAPITLASGSGWPIIGWYEYLNLRLNGVEAQTRLNDIEQDINQEEVSKVLSHLKELLDAEYFADHHRLITWKSSLPALFRGQVAMALYGNFIESTLPEHIAPNIGYFPFPEINAFAPDYEIAPTDILLISKNSRHQKQSAQFLTYVAQPAVQEKLNLKLKQISPNKLSETTETSPLAKEGVPVLKNSAGLSQYFDREVTKSLSDAYIQLWIDFIDNPDVDGTIAKMQQVREKLRVVKK